MRPGLLAGLLIARFLSIQSFAQEPVPAIGESMVVEPSGRATLREMRDYDRKRASADLARSKVAPFLPAPPQRELGARRDSARPTAGCEPITEGFDDVTTLSDAGWAQINRE
jgi:hypothetical protein